MTWSSGGLHAAAPRRGLRRFAWIAEFVDARRRHHVAWLALCFLFAAAAILSAVLLLTHPVPAGNEPWLWAMTALCFVAGVGGVWIEVPREGVLEALILAGIAMVTAAVLLSGGNGSPWAIFYAWIGVEGALLLAVRPAVRVNAVGLVAYSLVLALAPGDGRDLYAMTVGSMIVIGVLAWLLRLRVDRLAARLHETARIDALTGMLNRRGYQEAVNAQLATARREGRQVSVVVGDLDKFTVLNERHGHRRGDDALLAFADACATIRRGGDVAARTGGKQFALVLPVSSPAEALGIAERLGEMVKARLEDLGTPTTVSFGIASYPEHGRSAETVLDAADQACLLAKSEGRDRAVVYSVAGAEKLRLRRAAPREAAEQLDAVLLLAETLDVRDASTARHSQTVGAYAEQTAMSLGLPDDQVSRIRLAGLLHDIGKLGVPDAILHKPGRLSPEEYREIQRHPEVGARILASAGLPDLGRWVMAHHERPDGGGYPLGLTLHQIPLEARILSVADAFEAMTADRVYSPAMPFREAAAELRRGTGSQFDEPVVAAFLAAITVSGDLRVA